MMNPVVAAGYFFVALLTYWVVRFLKFLRQDADSTIFNKVAPPRAFRGKVVVITGASSGIGEALAYAVARRGATVVLVARRAAELDRVLEKCMRLGCDPKSSVSPADMLDVAKHAELVQQWVKKYTRIDYFVINHGRTQRALVESTKIEVDKAMFDLNVLSVISLIQSAVPHMLDAHGGQIMITSSVAGLVGAPCSATYSATKHAVNGYIKALNAEVASRGVVAQIACPGPVETPIQEHLFQSTLESEPVKDTVSMKRMSATRCAELMAAQLFYKINEAWMADQPFLLYSYLGQYCPALTWKVAGEIVGPRRVEAFKGGELGYKTVKGSLWKAVGAVVKGILGMP